MDSVAKDALYIITCASQHHILGTRCDVLHLCQKSQSLLFRKV